MHHLLKMTASAAVITLMTGAAAYATSTTERTTTTKQTVQGTTNNITGVTAAKTAGADAITLQNDAFITLSGTVKEVTDEDAFQLQYAEGTIKVDTNDAWPDLFQENATSLLRTGDNVTVTGKVDNNLFTANEVEAYQLTVNGPNYNRVYTNNEFGPDNDSSYVASYGAYGAGLEDDQKVRLSGEVSRLVDNESFMLRYGTGEITVNAADVKFSDAARLAVGDEIVVFGEVDKGLFSKKTLDANRIILSREYSQVTR